MVSRSTIAVAPPATQQRVAPQLLAPLLRAPLVVAPLLLALVAACGDANEGEATAPAALLAPTTPPATLVPTPSREDRAASAGWLAGGDWLGQHGDINALARARPGLQLVFLGDSITQSWGGPGRHVGATGGAVWEQHFGAFEAANFGISGDRTQHLLWRIAHGNLDGLSPEVLVLMIGTNNLPHDAPADIAAGITAVLDAVAAALPRTRIVLHGLLPRGRTADAPLRAEAAEVQRLIADLGQREGVVFVDLWPHVLDGEGVSRPDVFSGDWLHLAPGGYAVWAEALAPHLGGLEGGR